MITAVHVCCWEGMIFSEPRIALQNLLDKLFGVKISTYIQKPLFSCLMCMSSFWGAIAIIIFKIPSNEWIFTILCVCGLNAIITFFVKENT